MQREVACCSLTISIAMILKDRSFMPAYLLREWAACSESAAGRNVNGAGHIALQQLPLLTHVWVGNRNRLQKSTGIRMLRRSKYVVSRTFFYNYTKVHNTNAVADVPYNRQIMSNEQVRKS